ncbi:MAG: 3'(2'),5'-bisphosphate nucleotidase CysQ [Maricaulis sp.]|uniref:3'(2'),5'-bisphosphate nucleotidase CysQ n=1 Tax=Maricaulis sp. TaxID=1486257 RepID=UPI001B2A219E|nr:3'(2'),5'-bisphosphate nucleotidase CysQ [Maricaulis sp.]MBO6729838.1 3'(2'),5'-bisphosphate nucleotidase CysQ [Maricaulis sp.]MBO6848068.1 3'(2'),5'-bisphosphate nucleotidase CysQ [Maricaulis sp.]MBO6877858.1 3'(2'),5'-bisphosphate nucleotidase CysQ [Maricaulis sp.]
MIDIQNRDSVAFEFARICSLASEVIMEVYNSGFEVRGKDDKSPVTDADERAEKIILAELKKNFADIPVLAEESFSAGIRPQVDGVFILVDPVDGTKEFINKNGEFTVNIALIANRVPVAGCVYAPAIEKIYVGGQSAWTGDLSPGAEVDKGNLSDMRIREAGDTLTAVMSRSHADEKTLNFAEKLGVTERVSAGSSLKFCLVAEGSADVYPRFGPTMEWDTGAGHAVLAAAGGRVTTPEGNAFLYAKQDTGYLNGAFIAWGGLQS